MKPIPVPSLAEDKRRPEDPGEAKVLVLVALAHIVEGGGAVVTIPGASTRELRFVTGEIFQLGEETITRVA
jgi:hypothetical protein